MKFSLCPQWKLRQRETFKRCDDCIRNNEEKEKSMSANSRAQVTFQRDALDERVANTAPAKSRKISLILNRGLDITDTCSKKTAVLAQSALTAKQRTAGAQTVQSNLGSTAQNDPARESSSSRDIHKRLHGKQKKPRAAETVSGAGPHGAGTTMIKEAGLTKEPDPRLRAKYVSLADELRRATEEYAMCSVLQQLEHVAPSRLLMLETGFLDEFVAARARFTGAGVQNYMTRIVDLWKEGVRENRSTGRYSTAEKGHAAKRLSHHH